MNYELRHISEPLPEPVRIELYEDEADPFGVHDSDLAFAPKDRFVIAFDGSRPVAAAGWLARDVRAGSHTVAAAGLGSVLVRASCRGRGLGRIVVSEAMAAAAAAGRTHGILLCKPQLEPLYAHLGWSPIVGEVTFTEPDRARQPVPLLVMVRS